MSAIRDILVDNDRDAAVNGRAPAFDISEPPRKRPRVNQACETCRERKTRCDGHQPVCKACEKRGVGASCSYVRQKRASMNDSPRNQVHYTSPIRSTNTRPFDGTGFAAINHRSADTPSHKSDDEPLGNHRLASIQQTDSGGVDRPSSVTALFRSISDEQEPSNDTRQVPQWRSTATYPRTSTSASEPERLAKPGSIPHVLPRRRDADNYVQCYWDNIHPIYPLLHKPTFMKAYDRLWLAEDITVQAEFDENMYMATLNMIFAIGSRISQNVPNEHKHATADDFYQRSRRFFCYDVMDAASVPMIQLLLLSVLHLQPTNLTTRSWNTLGLAVRAAQTVGLHEISSSTTFSQLEREMRRRIWYTCVTLDRFGAYAYDKPSMIHTVDLPLPNLIDDEYLDASGEGKQPADKKSHLSTFVYSCRILSETADCLVPITSGSVKDPTIDKGALRRVLDRAISIGRCVHDVSASASPEQSQTDSAWNLRASARIERSLIQVRLLTISFLAGRPLLSHLAQQDAMKVHDRTIDQELLVKLGVQAIIDAQDILTILHRHRSDVLLADACNAIHLSFMIVLTLLAAYQCPRKLIAEDSLLHFWDMALHIIDSNHEQDSQTADAVRTLTALKTRILAEKTSTGNGVGSHAQGASAESLDSRESKPEVFDICVRHLDLTREPPRLSGTVVCHPNSDEDVNPISIDRVIIKGTIKSPVRTRNVVQSKTGKKMCL